ncbi:hypothetical protein ACIQU5_00585 [Streptomyces sp. NPDC090306]|uniref:hypothetical protein n=1 Tax=Streptomyces sp. NPDC090306 TaxID=3365961 RepID=UPI003807D7A8
MGAIKDKGRQLHQIKRLPYEEAFLIGDLLTTSITMLSGEPKAGKTLLTAGIGIALLNGHKEFLGQPVLQHVEHIVFGLTDEGAPEELKERLYGAVPDGSVTVFPVADPGDPGYWRGIRDDLAELKPASSSWTTSSAHSHPATTSLPPPSRSASCATSSRSARPASRRSWSRTPRRGRQRA